MTVETFIAIINWVCFEGTNEFIAAFSANNSLVVFPVALYIFYWWRAKAAATPEKWDDELVERVGKRLGLIPEKED